MNQVQINSLREALKFSPDNSSLRKLLCDALFNSGNYAEAEIEYKNAIQLSPNDISLKLGLSNCFYFLQKYSATQVVLEEILEVDKSNAAAYFLLSKNHLAQNEIQESKINYDKAIALNNQLKDSNYENELNAQIKESGAAATVSAGDDEFVDNILLQSEIEKPKIKFSDVGGMEAMKEEIALKVIHPLNNPEIYKAFGKKIGGGILFYGPPGCGKTMLARATAGEINANFISVGINEVLDMWMGNSEKNLHNIFEAARVNAPCVLFFDEVDALGASRSDMRNASGRFIINQFLDELDGVKYSNEGVLILAATNCPWYLDTAFRRPGRFDRIVFVQPPDAKAREEILKLLSHEKPFENIDFANISKLTEEYSGADLKAVVDVAIESKLPESMKQGKIIPVTTSDLKNAITKHKATTKEWFATARNYALYSNESGLYDDILKYLKIKK